MFIKLFWKFRIVWIIFASWLEFNFAGVTSSFDDDWLLVPLLTRLKNHIIKTTLRGRSNAFLVFQHQLHLALHTILNVVCDMWLQLSLTLSVKQQQQPPFNCCRLTDVNECRLTPSICGSEQECQNIPGSYRCTRRTPTCSLGYRPNLSGTQCIGKLTS